MKQNIQIHKDFISINEKLRIVIDNFNSTGIIISKGDRNKVKLFDCNEIKLNIKSFKIPLLLNQIIYKYFRKSKARRSYAYANILIEKNIGTPQPIAFFENISIVGLKESYYVSHHLNYDLTFRELVTNPQYPDLENILRQFTQFTWKMHEKGVYFKDHSPGNTLIVKNEENYNFYLVDLNRMSFFKLDFEARMKNLSRLTPKKEMIQIMSDEYAKISEFSYEKIFEKVWFYTEQFQYKYHRKKRLKQLLLGKK